MPNRDLRSVGGRDLRITDIYGNQVDGEFLGNSTGFGSWETLQPDGSYRVGLSGDGVPGGAFETGYMVVPNGNVFYARPDYVDSPNLTSDDPDGSRAKPYPTLAAEADPSNTALQRRRPEQRGQLRHRLRPPVRPQPERPFRPLGPLRRPGRLGPRPGGRRGPAGRPTARPDHRADHRDRPSSWPRRPAPTRSPGLPRDASTSVPANTTLAFDAGSTLKLFNASLYVQNQGSALQAQRRFQQRGPRQLHVAGRRLDRRRHQQATARPVRGGDIPDRRRLGRHHLPQLRPAGPQQPRAVPGRRPAQERSAAATRFGQRRRPVERRLRPNPVRRRPGPADPGDLAGRADDPVQRPAGGDQHPDLRQPRPSNPTTRTRARRPPPAPWARSPPTSTRSARTT